MLMQPESANKTASKKRPAARGKHLFICLKTFIYKRKFPPFTSEFSAKTKSARLMDGRRKISYYGL